MTFLMTPDMANFSGHVHGGTILKLLDQVAYACAARYCKNYVVTASLDQVIFKESIKVGELVTFRANVNYVGRTSMEIGIKVMIERRLFEAGKMRKKMRNEIMERNKALHVGIPEYRRRCHCQLIICR
jgi:acyl-CoA hydrolase